MKNGQRITEWLDYCAETLRCIQSQDIELVSSVIERSNVSDGHWNTLLADGWTQDELDAAYARRFNIDAATIARWRGTL